MTTIDLQGFLINLNQTVGWCKPRVRRQDPKYCLRSQQLRPDIEFDMDPPWDVDVWIDSPMVEQVVRKRSQLLSNEESQLVGSKKALEDGSLLLHFIDYTNHNGLTAGITSYFLDNNDSPPWDTWVQALHTTDGKTDFLVSWVPTEFVDSVDDATKAECIGMLMWAVDGQRWRGEGDVDFDTLIWPHSGL